ncbi:hemopexin [Pontibacter mucosus]|uniref:Hemopexin n=1 Tax=Pontibacter mucosus TaxID=1649266 RepID=A0A2T5YHR5_9BACT|nr:hemopexin repeat-containing protein [Pontibacter mucosus]PTX18856.1 hemopexin [Pontibacter mucosus]
MRNGILGKLPLGWVFILLAIQVISLQAVAQQQPAAQRNGMLILGSADRNTLVERVEIGYRLFAASPSFDYIVVSGGCAAHQSRICEASEMKELLVAKGVPAEIIFEEEKSKTTVQNYTYSRLLRKADGTKVIRPGDKLYVVSNHWHAIPVAARFTANDGVTAVYHIEGGILPKNTDKVNYTNIFDPEVKSGEYVAKALWPMVGAGFTVENKKKREHTTYRLINDLVYVESTGKSGSGSVEKTTQALPALPAAWAGEVDAAYFNSSDKKVYIFKGTEYARFSPEAKTLDAGYPKPLTDLVKNLPTHWHNGYLDAAFFHPKSKAVFLFKGEEYLQVPAGQNKGAGEPQPISTLVGDWPFAWGSGNLDAADYNSRENKVYLFRGKEFVVISLEGSMKVEPGYPKNIEVAWPESILGKK